MNNKHLTVKKLDKTNLKDVMQLQDKIIANLPADEQHFILHRTKADYMKSLDSSSSNMLGVFDGNELIAQAIYGLPKNGETRDMPEFKSDLSNDRLVIFEAILVNPVYRGSGLMQKMLEHIEKHAIDKNRTHSIIQIAIDNPASWINALHHGMKITKVDNDPTDGVKVIYLEKDIAHKTGIEFSFQEDVYSMYLGKNIHKKIPCLFSKMQYLIKAGYKGVALDKQTHCLVWHKEAYSRDKSFYFDFAYRQHLSGVHTL